MQQIGVVGFAGVGGLTGQLLVFSEHGRQLELLEIAAQKQIRRGGHEGEPPLKNRGQKTVETTQIGRRDAYGQETLRTSERVVSPQ